MAQVLEGITVLDVSTIIAGPSSAAFLAEFGANVIHIESKKAADTARAGTSGTARTLNRNKKCVTLDFHMEESRELFYEMCKKADVIITNFRLSALKRFQIDYEDILPYNPNIVYTHFSAFGRTGPRADMPGFARIAEAYSGLTYITGEPDRAPQFSGSWIVDGIGGIHVAYSTMLALFHRQRTGEGQLVDVGLYEPMFRILDELPLGYSLNGTVKERNGNIHSSQAPNNMYKTSDGVWVVLPVNFNMFDRFAVVMGRTDMLEDPRYNTPVARRENREEVDKIAADWVAGRTYAQLHEELLKGDVAHGLVNSIADICNDEHIWERGSLFKVYDEKLQKEVYEPGIIPHLSKTPGEYKWSGPGTGADNDEIYTKWLGLPQERYEELRKKGAI